MVCANHKGGNCIVVVAVFVYDGGGGGDEMKELLYVCSL